ncbi:MAG: AI-2E family transporter [Elusimicrobiaceae bacterium]|nr:AI-2E family transporter [Elusimicrobiaceae bacterium]
MLPDKSTYYYLKTTALCLTIIAAGVVTAFLVYTKALLIPLVISIFLYTILAQTTLYLRQKFHFPQWLALTTSIVLGASFFTAVILFTVTSVGQFLQGAETYRQNLITTAGDLVARLQHYGITLDQTFIENYIRELPIFNWLKNFGGKLFSVVSNITLIVLFMTFFLLGSKKPRPITNPTIKEMLANVSVYLSVKLMASLITGLLVAFILLGFQVKMAVLFALFAFLLNFIPSVGSIVSVILPVPVLFLQYNFSPTFFIIIGLLAASEFIIGNLVEPRFLGEGMDLHPVAVVGSLIFWSLVWGVPGAFLSVPLTASLKIILGKIKQTRPVAEILAGRLPH